MSMEDYACFVCRQLDMLCQRCGRNIQAGEQMQATLPSHGNRWTDKRCYPNCEKAALAASRRTVPLVVDLSPRTKTFPSQFEGTECIICFDVIEIGEYMTAEVCPLEYPKWQNTRHRSCPCPPELLNGLSEGLNDGAWSASDPPTVTCARCLKVFSGSARKLCSTSYAGTVSCSNCSFLPPVGSCSELEEEEEDSEEENDEDEKKEEEKSECLIMEGDAPSISSKRPRASSESTPSTPPRLSPEPLSARTRATPPAKKRRPGGDNPLARESKPVVLSMSARQPQEAENQTQGAENLPPGAGNSQAVRALFISTRLAARAAAEVETESASAGADDDAEVIREVSVEEQIMQKQREQGVIDVDEVSQNLAVAEGWTVSPIPESVNIEVEL